MTNTEKALREALLAQKRYDGEDGLPCWCDESPTGDNYEKRGITEQEAKCAKARAGLARSPAPVEPVHLWIVGSSDAFTCGVTTRESGHFTTVRGWVTCQACLRAAPAPDASPER